MLVCISNEVSPHAHARAPPPPLSRTTVRQVCKVCQVKFSAFKRRHHCRQCGACVCSLCSAYDWIMPHISASKPVRVCRTCYFSMVSRSRKNSDSACSHSKRNAGGGGAMGVAVCLGGVALLPVGILRACDSMPPAAKH